MPHLATFCWAARSLGATAAPTPAGRSGRIAEVMPAAICSVLTHLRTLSLAKKELELRARGRGHAATRLPCYSPPKSPNSCFLVGKISLRAENAQAPSYHQHQFLSMGVLLDLNTRPNTWGLNIHPSIHIIINIIKPPLPQR